MLASSPLQPVRGFAVRKGIVGLLVALALIVIISPAIVGRLAEKSMDENLDWAAEETQEVVVTSQGFDRGWFSSEGQHRVEIREGQLQDMLMVFADPYDGGQLPALIINTRLDHGLIPVSSMSRDGGTLMPGLGSAVSTLSVELADGEIVALPGVINSTVGLTGELHSNFALGPGTKDVEGNAATWGAIDIDITTSPANGKVNFAGLVESLAITSDSDTLRVEAVEFSGDQQQTPFGFAVGSVNAVINTIAVREAGGRVTALGPLSVDGTSSLDGDRVSGRSAFRFKGTPSPELGDISIAADISIIDFDAAAVGKLKRTFAAMQPVAGTDELLAYAEKDAQRLFASGFQLRIDRLDIVMPQGPVTSKFNFVVDASDADSFNWTSVLLALDASADISISSELVDMAAMMNPEINGVVAMGFLKKKGDSYEMEAAFKKGLLTINGAPMPIPLPGTY
jgi:uncharacterized protein YdgA (DUF945 family)